jgi:hypothetical protein
MEVYIHAFIPSALDGEGWLFNASAAVPRSKYPLQTCRLDRKWVDPGDDLGAVVKRKVSVMLNMQFTNVNLMPTGSGFIYISDINSVTLFLYL